MKWWDVKDDWHNNGRFYICELVIVALILFAYHRWG